MKTVSPFLELEEKPRVGVTFEGERFELPEGENLAASLLAAGVRVFRRTPVSDAPRAPFCMMGACFDCLVEIDGVVRQACMIDVVDELEIVRPGAEAAKGTDDAAK
ncbi:MULTISPECIES: (2Fe-2S)-binding protein [Sediminimonas]|uniref:(2Fe-2S)-binding protein n=1 Tax=Sediminimonas TaxID=659427 RepID=UPI00041D3A7F|nr:MULTISPECIES: (2Fe-2S)-binding protein [Sediminimonas]MDR9485924.1 (2Fe-2S)-binding protein [Sediminimonas sp.]